jgi:hypothetical protein
MAQPNLPMAPNTANPLRTHTGEAFDSARWQLYAPPPPEIGEVLSVSCDVKHGARAPTIVARVLFAILFGAIGATIGLLAGLLLLGGISALFHLSDATLRDGSIAVGALGGALGMYLGFVGGGIGGALEYVGRDGLAIFHFRGRPEDTTPVRVLRFADANALTTKLTAVGAGRGPVQTKYAFEWFKGGEWAPAFEIIGTFRTEGDSASPPPHDRYHFARAAEVAWTIHVRARASRELQERGYVEFKMLRGQKDPVVRVGSGFLEFVRGGEVDRCQTGDVAEISVHDGAFTVKRRDAKVGWFSSTGVYRFPYSEMENAKCFLIVLAELAGFSFARPPSA